MNPHPLLLTLLATALLGWLIGFVAGYAVRAIELEG